MRYLKPIFEDVEKIKNPEWDKLVVYKSEEIEKLCSSFSFDRDFKKTLDKCLNDVYGDKNYSYDKTSLGYRRLVQTILNNMNWYCHSKQLYNHQIYLPGIIGIDQFTHIDSVYYQKKFMNSVKRLFDYMWAFRKAIFKKNTNSHADVAYLQKSIFKPLISQDLITIPKEESNKKISKFKTYDPDSGTQKPSLRSKAMEENARRNQSLVHKNTSKFPKFERLNKVKTLLDQ